MRCRAYIYINDKKHSLVQIAELYNERFRVFAIADHKATIFPSFEIAQVTLNEYKTRTGQSGNKAMIEQV